MTARHHLEVTSRLSFIIGLAVGVAVTAGATRFMSASSPSRDGFAYLSASATCQSLIGTRLTPLDTKLKEFIASASAGKGDVYHAYVRDLSTGEWFGVGEDDLFQPGSLMKLPLAIGYMKWSESDATVLERLVQPTIQQASYQEAQGYAPLEKVSSDRQYSVRDLVRRALVYSDNAAASALESLDQHRSIMKVAMELNVPVREGIPPLRPISIREYSKLFISLFNSTYLSHENSDWLLSRMSESEFVDGLRGGVPADIRIAHKFGESFDEKSNMHYLSDCGIVYLPGHPYVACVSSYGKDPATLARGLKAISGEIFKVYESAAKADLI